MQAGVTERNDLGRATQRRDLAGEHVQASVMLADGLFNVVDSLGQRNPFTRNEQVKVLPCDGVPAAPVPANDRIAVTLAHA
jgi:hypothetical protein